MKHFADLIALLFTAVAGSAGEPNERLLFPLTVFTAFHNGFSSARGIFHYLDSAFIGHCRSFIDLSLDDDDDDDDDDNDGDASRELPLPFVYIVRTRDIIAFFGRNVSFSYFYQWHFSNT